MNRTKTAPLLDSLFLNYSSLLTHIDPIKKFADILVLHMTFLLNEKSWSANKEEWKLLGMHDSFTK
jgi:hypothetical protein